MGKSSQPAQSDCRRDYSQGIAIGHSIGYGKKETVHSRDFWKRYCIKTTLTEHIRALSMIKPEKNITGKKDSRYGAMENVSINLCIGRNKSCKMIKRLQCPLICYHIFTGFVAVSFGVKSCCLLHSAELSQMH